MVHTTTATPECRSTTGAASGVDLVCVVVVVVDLVVVSVGVDEDTYCYRDEVSNTSGALAPRCAVGS
jgi:hypothetical protein